MTIQFHLGALGGVTLFRVALRGAVLYHVIPCCTTVEYVVRASCMVPSCVTQCFCVCCCAAWWCVLLRVAAWWCARWCYVVLRVAILYCVMLCCVAWCGLCRDTWCFVLLRDVVLCCMMLCYAAWCSLLLRDAVCCCKLLCYVALSFKTSQSNVYYLLIQTNKGIQFELREISAR